MTQHSPTYIVVIEYLSEVDAEDAAIKPFQHEVSRMKSSFAFWNVGILLAFVVCLNAMPVMAVESSRTITGQPKPEESIGSAQPPLAPPTDFLYFKINHVYRSQGKGPFNVLENGSTIQSGDHYKIIFTPNQDCYVYIFQVDSANMVYSLFPMEQFGKLTLNNLNPIKAGQTYYIPAEEKSFILDNQTGTERIYFLASFERDPELEAEYQRTVETQKQRNIEEQLRQIDRLLNYAIDLRGEAEIIVEPDTHATTSWQEEGHTFSVLQHRLENMCDGCVHVLTFTHQ